MAMEIQKKPKRVGLDVDKTLLDPNFEGYKLGLEPIPLKIIKLQQPASSDGAAGDSAEKSVLNHKAAPNLQWSFEHVKLFSSHNHLWPDLHSTHPHHLPPLYIFLNDCALYALQINKDGAVVEMKKVLVIPYPPDMHNRGDKFNPSLHFLSPNDAFVSDGCGHLLLYDTGDRHSFSQWKLKYGGEEGGVGEKACGGSAFVVRDSVLEGRELSVVVERLEEINNPDNSEPQHPFTTLIEWVTYSVDDTEKKLTRTRRLELTGNVDHCGLSTDATKICIGATAEPRFVFDNGQLTLPQDTMEVDNVDESVRKEYSWGQSGREVCGVWGLGEGVGVGDVEWRLSAETISLKVGGRTLVEGELGGGVSVDESTWIIADGRLEVTLFKSNELDSWTEFVKEDNRGEYVVNPDLVKEMGDRLAKFTCDEMNPDPVSQSVCNTEQLEECDTAAADTSVLYWIDGDTHLPIYEADIGGRQVLFSTTLKAETNAGKSGKFLCLRHDVDGIVWNLHSNPLPNQLWSHEVTFPALGYVQASKTQRKFITSSSDFSYAVIVDWTRHAYVYWQPSMLDTNLRNRVTGQKVHKIAKQHVVSLDSQEEILGVFACKEVLVLLTESQLFIGLMNQTA